MCRWILENWPGSISQDALMLEAAHRRKWPAVKILCKLLIAEHTSAKDLKDLARDTTLQVAASCAAAQGNLDFFLWSQSQHLHISITMQSISVAAKSGNHAFLQGVMVLLPAMCPSNDTICRMAISQADVNVLSWMLAQGMHIDCKTLICGCRASERVWTCARGLGVQIHRPPDRWPKLLM